MFSARLSRFGRTNSSSGRGSVETQPRTLSHTSAVQASAHSSSLAHGGATTVVHLTSGVRQTSGHPSAVDEDYAPSKALIDASPGSLLVRSRESRSSASGEQSSTGLVRA